MMLPVGFFSQIEWIVSSFWQHCLQHVTTSMATRLEALENKILEFITSRLDFSIFISKLAMLSSNVKALTNAMVSYLKHSQEI